jgi:hypothetical protein
MMTKKIPIILCALFFLTNLHAFTTDDVLKIKNDKEAVISSFSKKEKERIMEKYNTKEIQTITSVFYETVLNFLNDDNKQCEADFYSRLIAELNKADIAHSKDAIDEHLKMLRSTNAIDDVLFDIITSLNEDSQKFNSLDLGNKPNLLFKRDHDERLENNNLTELYSSFKKWPDELTSCSTQEFIRLKESITVPNQSKDNTRLKYLGTLNYSAYNQGLISLSTYNRLEFLRTKSNLEKRYIWLNDYFKIILNVKNKMIPKNQHYEVKNLNAEDRFSTERLKRFSRLTRRKLLYQKYNENQIILLAQVMQKASRRMGVDPDTTSKAPYIYQEFEYTDENGERKNYVEKIEIDPQSQYNLARRLLRKDITDLQMMGLFNKTNVTYEDLVMASLEVGYISLEDIEFVVKYDDLWNPTTSKYERMRKFVFTSLGYSTFFLPPPFNIAASLALGVVEGIVDNNNKDGASNDNPGTFIE